jgi:hypothetical protein
MPGRAENLRVVDQVLTTVCRGYSNNELIGNKLFPEASVTEMGGKIPLWGKEDFKIWNTKRALRADSNEMDGAWLSTTPFAMTEHDLQQRLDYLELENAKMIPLEAKAAQNVMNSILLGYEKEQADLAQNLATYGSDNKETLTDNFYNEDAIDWIELIHTKKNVLSSFIAKDPNLMVIGRKVWDNLKFHPILKSYITVAPSLFQAVATLDKLKEILEIENIVVGNSRYLSGDTFDYCWGNNIILAYVTPPSPIGRTPYEPCFGYTLRKNGFPYADKYDTNGGKIRNVRATDCYDIKVVGAESALIINNPIDPLVYTPS